MDVSKCGRDGKVTWYSRKSESFPSETGNAGGLRAKLARSRSALARGLGALLGGGTGISDELFDDLEEVLITADVGVKASRRIVERSREEARRHRIADAAALREVLRQQMVQILSACDLHRPIEFKPYVFMVVGVNGVGKTTTIARIAKKFQDQGRSVLLGAADTFRAAAVEQLQRWGERLELPVIAQGQGADAAAVAHDALLSARARQVDVLLIDTAGRQHTHSDLMEQLKKVKRVLGNIDPEAPHEVLQVLDASTGQNALSQLQHFDAAVGVDSLCLTKLDGTAKGGVLLAIAETLPRSVRYLGVGEGPDDLQPFDAAQFVDALLPDDLR